ncbi:MAG: hypothetical protein AAGC44_10205 [Planctomycetota bacterium]
MLLIAILLPALGAARRTARRMQNSTQMRDIHQGMAMYSSSNRNFYPGLDSGGDIIADRPPGSLRLADYEGFNGSGDGDTVEARYWALFAGDFVAADYAVSPSEVDDLPIYDLGPNTIPAPVVWNTDSGDKHYSYAMLSINGEPGRSPDAPPRAAEWTQSVNPMAIVLSDRNTGSGTSDTQVRSIHTDDPGDWKGSVGWNDNSVMFEQSHDRFETKYGGTRNLSDNLFNDDGTAAADALMVVDADDGVSGNE